MPKDKADPLSNYSTRAFTLAAAQPIALPSARDYIIVAASVDPEAVQLTIDDNNGDPEYWPFGVQVRTNAKFKARLVSTVTQVVTVIMTDGDVEVRDNRNLPPMYNARFRFDRAVGAPLASTVVVTAAQNVRGILLVSASIACKVDPTANGSIFDTVNPILECYDSQVMVLGSPLIIPPGQQLACGATGGVTSIVVYRLL